ncbi:6-phosphogluconolactonase [Zhouia amylolytica]|uniref:6-phosphogluconolactonase n=1 Tax=Zhouia amylolytica TaxID=376730 RepID=UPI0020CC3E98|nr:6-phosphogluconolactonase [Zhouia amylolytica]
MRLIEINDKEFCKESAKVIADELQELQGKFDHINVALSGGSTPIPILKELKESNLKWEQFDFFLVDERCVPVNNEESNYKNLKECFFNYINSRSHPIIKDDNIDLDQLVSEYNNLVDRLVIREKDGVPSFDLVILGMGEDGHTASLFPETEGLSDYENNYICNYVPKLESYRITMTYRLINNADKIIILTKGDAKRRIFKKIKENVKYYPMNKVFYCGQPLTWIMDKLV